jgi:formate-dependent nitrite reductase membrane component NrfD
MANAEWGFLIATDLFFGGLSAGLFLFSVAALAYRKDGQPRYSQIAKVGAVLAPWPVIAASAILLADLGHWYRFYKLLLHFRITSPMSMGTWILSSFILVALMYCYAWLDGSERGRLFDLLPKRFGWMVRFNRDLSHLRSRLAIVGTPLALGVVLYPGLMLGFVQARPFWNTSLLAQLFVISAASVACAVLMLAALLSRGNADRELRILYPLNAGLLAAELGLVVAFVLYGSLALRPVREAMSLILGGEFTAWFWVAFVGIGILTPLLFAAVDIRKGGPARWRRHGPAIVAVLVVIGAYLLRCIVVFAGQRSAI